MEYGAADYIYKPPKRKEFELALNHIVGIFEESARRAEEDKQMLEDYGRDTVGIFRQRFLANLTGGILSNESEIRGSMKYFEMTLEPPYAVITLRIDRFKTVMAGLASTF
jgi:YesN/AraC family two-component response regulator